MSELDCPFCRPAAERLFHVGERVLGLWDAFPASPNHALLVPKRHVATWFDASPEERRELMEAVDVARARILERASPDGWNVGFNVGSAGGQTVFHLHVHVIPRYAGDVPDPRGGVRLAIPAKGNYLADGGDPLGGASILREKPFPTPFPLSEARSAESKGVGPAPFDSALRASLRENGGGGPSLTSGGDDPLLPILSADLGVATSVDAAIAFVMASGLDHLEPHFEDVLARGGKIRFLAGDYLDVTDPVALRRLLDLRLRHPSALDLRIFVSGNRSFHPKTWILRGPHGGVAWIGSSNLSRSALHDGIEWNFRVIPSRDAAGFASAERAFEQLLAHPSVRAVDAAWIDAYAARRRAPLRPGTPPGPRADAPDPLAEAEPALPPPTPNPVQEAALAALADTRARGNEAGLVVLATGLGKTWLAAFDSERGNFERVLFVAHREEILDQARKTFRRIRPDASIGFYDGTDKITDSDILFASIQTLGRRAHLEQFPRDAFDFIVVDEFHHASAATYRRLLDHFTPKFLLALTATPERTDGGDLLGLCGENLVFRADLVAGIEQRLLAPFHYFGVPDDVEYANIPWRSSRFDEAALTQAVATTERAKNVLEQHKKRGGARTLAFCVSQTHADFMKAFFVAAGVRAASVHSGAGSDPRTDSLERLTRGELATPPHPDDGMFLRVPTGVEPAF